ncbi:MAG: T9SS type A sorting domain-containing protein [Flavobacteriales bacterium]|nr:T9SS type A sorting domain-containing protein [Flavobacteriales bacterium]
MKNAILTTAIFSRIGAVLLLLISSLSLDADDLLRDLGEPILDREQKHFLKHVTENPINHSIRYVEVNWDALKKNQFEIEPIRGDFYEVVKNERGEQYAGLTSWCGTIDDGVNYGDINMVINKDELVAHFMIGNRIFAITPLGKGIHVFYEVDSSVMPPEQCINGRDKTYDYNSVPKSGKDHPDLAQHFDGSSKATGECEIRVLVGFTSGARDSFTSILAELVNQFNLANSAFDNANVGFNIEMAMAYNVGYNASGSLNTDLNRWETTNDGIMDDVHSNRTLFDADMCALIVPGGGGLASLSTDYDQTFSVTGINNFTVFTFHHELGHNMLCTHDLLNPSQPGTAPFAGYGEPTNACFRTILAYQEACGSETGCPRVNVFSRSIGTYNCGGTNYAKGGSNNRNRDRLAASKNTINNHTTVLSDPSYSGDYDWSLEEAIHFAGQNTLTYNSSSNNWEMQNNSEGSFRASESVTLGEGFWARSGSTFTAYLESCTDISPDAAPITADAPIDEEEQWKNHEENIAAEFSSGYGHFNDLKVFPNPFRESTNVVFDLQENDKSVSLTIRDIAGREIISIINQTEMSAGQHVIEVQTADLPNGIYLLTLQAGEEVMVERIIKGD